MVKQRFITYKQGHKTNAFLSLLTSYFIEFIRNVSKLQESQE